MRTMSATVAVRANSLTEQTCGDYRTDVRCFSLVMQKARDVFPDKTAQYLADLTGYSPRAAEYWLCGERRMPADALASLLRSEHGREFLDAVMDGAEPAWWMRTLAYFGLADAAALQAKARRKVRAVLYADENLATLHSRGEAAALHADEDFYRPMVEARRAANGGAPRAMDSKAGRR